MPASVSGCSCPSTLFFVSITCTSSPSASFHRPSSLYANATIAWLLNVSLSSLPNCLLTMHTMLRYIVVRPTLLTNRPPPAAALVLNVHEGKAPCTFPSSRIFQQEIPHRGS